MPTRLSSPTPVSLLLILIPTLVSNALPSFAQQQPDSQPTSVSPFIKAHATLMTLAFMTLYPTASLIAHALKPHLSSRALFFSKPFWFILHAVLMLVATAASVTAFALVQLTNGGFLKTRSVHGYVGFATITLMLLQVAVAFLLRPVLDTKHRRVWYASHVLVALCVAVMGSANMFLGVDELKWNNIKDLGRFTPVLATFAAVVGGCAVLLQTVSVEKRENGHGDGGTVESETQEAKNLLREEGEQRRTRGGKDTKRWGIVALMVITSVACGVAMVILLETMVPESPTTN